MAAKEFDVILLGATGFTGRLVAQHLTKNYAPTDLRWAIAGRNEAKLNAIKASLGNTAQTVEILLADNNDEASLRHIASRTKVIISTVGPYAFYGSLLVKVCAELGTHYCDLTGEVPWMRRMIDAHEQTAKASGACIIHCCGFDSIPSDLGVQFLQQQAQHELGHPFTKIDTYLMHAKGGFSGGTVHSLINVVKEAAADATVAGLLRDKFALVPELSGKQRARGIGSAKYDKQTGLWLAPFVMAAINSNVVMRSSYLAGNANLDYCEATACGTGYGGVWRARLLTLGIGLLMLGLSKPFSRKLLERYLLPAPSEGPKIDPARPGHYRMRFIGSNEEGAKLTADVTGDADPGYGSTSKMLAETAVLLAQQESAPAGFQTPASALGSSLRERLIANAGLSFTVVKTTS